MAPGDFPRGSFRPAVRDADHDHSTMRNTMHRLSARRLAATAVVASTSLLLAACSSGAGSSDKADTSGTAPTGVTLTMWHNSGDSKALLDLYKAYEKASGNTIDLVGMPSDTYPNAV